MEEQGNYIVTAGAGCDAEGTATCLTCKGYQLRQQKERRWDWQKQVCDHYKDPFNTCLKLTSTRSLKLSPSFSCQEWSSDWKLSRIILFPVMMSSEKAGTVGSKLADVFASFVMHIQAALTKSRICAFVSMYPLLLLSTRSSLNDLLLTFRLPVTCLLGSSMVEAVSRQFLALGWVEHKIYAAGRQSRMQKIQTTIKTT